MRKRLISLDLIRILATFSILLFHYDVYCTTAGVETPHVYRFIFASGNLGDIGVSLFFILSGASLMLSYERSGGNLAVYWKHRVVSIYPLYWSCFAAMYLYCYKLRHFPVTYPKWTLLLSFLGFDGYLYYRIPSYALVGDWFVGAIILMYVLFPLLYRCVRKHPVLTLLVVAVLYVPYVKWYPFAMDIGRFPLTRIPDMLAGMYWVEWFYHRKEKKQLRTDCPWYVGVPALALFALSLFVQLPFAGTYRSLWMGVSAFLGFSWLLSFFEALPEKVHLLIGALSGSTYAVFLIHHTPIGDFAGLYERGIPIFRHPHFLFWFYVVLVTLAGVIMKYLTTWALRPAYGLWHRWKRRAR